MKVLVLDIGGTHVKVYRPGRLDPVKISSSPTMTPKMLVKAVREATDGWSYDVVSIGYPGPVAHGRALRDPQHLGKGWVGFDFRKAFGRPVQVVNDAALQALGSYRGGRMLFLGLGTGLGSALVVDGVLQPMELAHLPYKHGKTFEEYVGAAALERLGKKRWARDVQDVVARLREALQAEYVVLGGGNAKRLPAVLPADTLRGDNEDAREGGLRLWRSRVRERLSSKAAAATGTPAAGEGLA
jgi:polyphosphate glucokinase